MGDDWESAKCIPMHIQIREHHKINDYTADVYVKTVIIIIYCIIFIFGFLGNGGVILAMCGNRRLRSARNFFLLNLIITDLMLVLTAVPVTPWYALTKDWQFGSAMCHIMPFSNSCSVFVSSWSLTAISIDKFMHIMNPTTAPVSKKQAGCITFLIWTLSTIINYPYFESFELVDGSHYAPKNGTPICGHFCDETNWKSPERRKLYGTIVMLLQFVVPMIIISFCYFCILHKVAKDSIVQNAQFCHSLTQKQRVDAVNRKKRVNYILISMVVTFIVCWFPLTAVNIFKDYEIEPGALRAQPFLVPLVAHVIAMSIVLWNPLLFFWLTRKQKRLNLSRIINTSEIRSRCSSIMGQGLLHEPVSGRPSVFLHPTPQHTPKQGDLVRESNLESPAVVAVAPQQQDELLVRRQVGHRDLAAADVHSPAVRLDSRLRGAEFDDEPPSYSQVVAVC